MPGTLKEGETLDSSTSKPAGSLGGPESFTNHSGTTNVSRETLQASSPHGVCFT